MFGDLDQLLGQIEHLPLLRPRLHRRGQRGGATKADARRMPLDPSGASTCLSVSPLCPACPPLFLRSAREGCRKRAASSSARRRRRLGAVRASRPTRRRSSATSARRATLSACSASFSCRSACSRPAKPLLGPRRLVPALAPGDFAAQLRNVAYERVDRVANRRGAENHLHLNSCFRPRVSHYGRPRQYFTPTVANRTHPPWELLFSARSAASP